MYEYIYKQHFGQQWPDAGRSPYVQDLDSKPWEKTFEMVTDYIEQKVIMKHAYSFALIRDPKERLLSAWKSKVTCDNGYGVDKGDRAHWSDKAGQYMGFVQHLQRLRGKPENVTCMGLDEYAQALLDSHWLDRANLLDRHFLPQSDGCFFRFGPESWSNVALIDDTIALRQLAKRMGNSPTNQFHQRTRARRLW